MLRPQPSRGFSRRPRGVFPGPGMAIGVLAAGAAAIGARASFAPARPLWQDYDARGGPLGRGSAVGVIINGTFQLNKGGTR